MLKQAADNSGAPLKERFPARSWGKQHFPRIAPFSSPLMLIPIIPQAQIPICMEMFYNISRSIRVCGSQGSLKSHFPQISSLHHGHGDPRRRRSQIFANGHQQVLILSGVTPVPSPGATSREKLGIPGALEMEGSYLQSSTQSSSPPFKKS